MLLFKQAREWLADAQSQEVLLRLNSAAVKLATSLRGELSRDAAIETLLQPGDLDTKLLEYERELIKRALAQSEGKVTHAAPLLGKSYQGLAQMIETKHPDLISLRTPVRRRRRRKVVKTKKS